MSLWSLWFALERICHPGGWDKFTRYAGEADSIELTRMSFRHSCTLVDSCIGLYDIPYANNIHLFW